jgi:hypothetical protein
MEKSQKNITIENVINKYKKSYNIIFKYWVFILILIIAFILFTRLSHKTKQLDIDNTFSTQHENLLWIINSYEIEKKDNKITPLIIQWDFKIEDKLFISINNLVEYKWFILPKNVVLYDDTRLKSKEDFSSWYESKDLEIFIKNIIFTNNNTDDIKTNKLLPLNDNIEDTFYLKCTHNPKIFNFICNHYIDNFLDTFFIYDLSSDYKWLNDMFYNLKWTKNETRFCSWINKYVSYSKDTSANLEWILLQCWDNFYKIFNKTKLFLNVQNQLSEWYIKSNTTSDKEINEYKLISYQQILYNDTVWNIVNEARFSAYLNYVASLLKKDNLIDPIYYDITYWINNNYLIPHLNSLKYKLTDNKKQELENIINSLETINKWNNLDWFVWLETKVTNDNLKIQTTLNNTDSIITGNEWNIMQQLLNNIKHLSYLKIINEEISGNIIRVSWYMVIKWLENPIYFWANFKNENGSLVIIKIWITDYNELNEILSKMIQNWNYSIMEIYEYIQKNITLYTTEDKPSACDIIKWKTDSLWAYLSKCSDNNIKIITQDWITYDIKLKNYNIEWISVSDYILENDIKELINWVSTNYNTIWTIISEILSYKNNTDTQIENSNDTDIIISIGDITSFLWNNIVEINKNWTIIDVEFNINDITFIWNYNPTTKRLWPIWFKKWDLTISNFELYLNKDNQNKINEFTSDPIKFIKKINPEVISQYNNL